LLCLAIWQPLGIQPVAHADFTKNSGQTSSPAAHDPSEHLVMGNPSNAVTDTNITNNYLMAKLQFALSYNNDRGIPNWTSWHLDSTWRGSADRQDDYRNDTTLPPNFRQIMGNSYSGSGFDRGHMCPSADRTSSVADNSATFLMTNMVPQAPGNNRGPWAALEDDLRDFLPANELYIVSGGQGAGGTGSNGSANTINNGFVTVPAVTWKVALILSVGDNDVSRVDQNTRTIAVIMPNNDAIGSDTWQKYLATIDQIESLTGYDFYSNVSPDIQTAIESKLDAANDTPPVTTSQTKLIAIDHSVTVTLTGTDFNVNNYLSFTIVTPPQHGTLSGSDANRIYTPAFHYVGPDSFTFKANDGALDSNVSTVNISVGGPTASRATLSGRVTDEGGNPLAGVLLHMSGDRAAIAMTDIRGNYRFNDVDTNSLYTVTPSLANYHFAPAARSLSLLGNQTNVEFTAAADAEIEANAIDSNEFFVRQQYVDFLNREPDPAGFRYWIAQLNLCNGDSECVRARRVDVSAAFFIEREFHDTGFFIYRAYRAALGELPRYEQFKRDQNQIIGDRDIAARRLAFLNSFEERADFQRRYPASLTNDQFIDRLSGSAGIDNDSRQVLRDLVRSGATRVEVLLRLIELPEFAEREYNGAFVMTQYFGYLHRDVDPRGYEFWLNVLNNYKLGDATKPANGNFHVRDARATYRAMVCAFLTSAEYQRRFSSVVTRDNRECER